ncbi:hypothetical protein VKT23_007724 [Stygiomarasmius scandens]|uniref:C2H2-type domain-containing protein n=1 Tax=Marasmiellus scandens TaxID=2682957 RepID=A0ABR1JJQ4_9AGAR
MSTHLHANHVKPESTQIMTVQGVSYILVVHDAEQGLWKCPIPCCGCIGSPSAVFFHFEQEHCVDTTPLASGDSAAMTSRRPIGCPSWATPTGSSDDSSQYLPLHQPVEPEPLIIRGTPPSSQPRVPYVLYREPEGVDRHSTQSERYHPYDPPTSPVVTPSRRPSSSQQSLTSARCRSSPSSSTPATSSLSLPARAPSSTRATSQRSSASAPVPSSSPANSQANSQSKMSRGAMQAQYFRTLKENPEIHKIVIDPTIFQGRTGPQLLDVLASHLKELIEKCVYHSVMNVEGSLHGTLFDCPDRSCGQGSFYREKYTKALNVRQGQCICYECWFPIGMEESVLQHGSERCFGRNSRSRYYADWFRCLPFLVWRVEKLRKLIFGHLGIDDSKAKLLESLIDWTRWVTLPALNSDTRVTNFVAIVYAYLDLRVSKKIKPSQTFSFDPDAEIMI